MLAGSFFRQAAPDASAYLARLRKQIHIVYQMRHSADDERVFHHAARAHRTTRSEFMIEASRRAADDALLDQTLVKVDPDTYARFVAVLDQPPSSERFARLMAASPPWQR